MLIAEVGHERPLAGKPILDSVVDTPCTRFQPALLMSPAFIPGMLPPVLSTGECATGRIPRGLCVVSAMIASTTSAVRFVPAVRGATHKHGR